MRFAYLALAVLPFSAAAETFTIASKPTAVAVYGGFAVVTREVALEVEAGAHEVVLPDLPQWVDTGGLRVALRGATLAGTRLRTDALPPLAQRDTPEIENAKARIKSAEQALVALSDRAQDAGLTAQAAQVRLQFLNDIGSSDTLPSTPQALIDLGKMVEAETLTAARASLAAERVVREIEAGRSDLEQDLEDARAELAALTPPARAQSLLALSINAQDAGAVTASVSYPVQASWQPTYDIVLTRGGADTLTVRRAAIITQNSGENWEDIALILSTLAPNGQILPSEVYPPLLRLEDPAARAALEMSAGGLEDSARDAPLALRSAMAEPVFDGPGVTYVLPDPFSVAQSAEGARVELDTLTFDARVFARAVPAQDATAFLMAEITNDTMEPLLAASDAQLFVENTLVGQIPFEAVAVGARLTQAFGPIEELRLSNVILDQSEGDRGLITKSNAQTQERRLLIENLGAQEWIVEVLDAIPYSEQDDLTIEWSAQPSATATDVEDRRGLAQWDLTVAENAREEIRIERIVRWPEGMVLR
jgi:uncharacterized protein (TIGR02231 family)